MRLIVALVLVCVFQIVLGVDRNVFKTCNQSSFCTRCRNVEHGSARFALAFNSARSLSYSFIADIVDKDTKDLYTMTLEALKGNTFRLSIDEKSPLKPRYRVEHALKDKPQRSRIVSETKRLADGINEITLSAGPNKVVIAADPLRIDFYYNGAISVSLNAKGLMKFEALRKKPAAPVAGEWEEYFNDWLDTKPNGPEAVAMDFSFPEADVLFGIPSHADSFALKDTANTDPYRLYNLDVPFYETESPMALYGSVPVLYAHGPNRTTGVFWHNAAETWVDIYTAKRGVPSFLNFKRGSRNSAWPAAHFFAESGIIDVFIMLGPTPMETFKQYTDLTGTADLPQLYTLAYHQCRWNYKDQEDVNDVTANFDVYDIPMDIMWLDIEYTDQRKYFTWDYKKFPDPLGMVKNLTDLGRHLVIIIDPHIKADPEYFLHGNCSKEHYYVRKPNGDDYEGSCWPGLSSYIDFYNPVARSYYADQYRLENFNTVTEDVMIWNDMNEPSVFEGPEKTMPKDLIHFGNWEHRDVHNSYGLVQTMGTKEGLLKRDPNQRPFILTRAHFAGTQRYAAVWTGDNTANWSELRHSIKMCLSEAVAGISFCGADVGGFFNNPDPELFERWYQVGAFTPFFRSHSNNETKRREPWLYPKETQDVIREAIRKRYTYLPLWYTAFYEHEHEGTPVIRPLLAHYPLDKKAFAIEDTLLLQDRLLVRPVNEPNATKVDVYFPSIDAKNTVGDRWFDDESFQLYEKTGYASIPVDKFKIPVFQRGGSVIPKKERKRRASTLMKNDPYTLVICLNREGKASGTLYVDDEKSFKYRSGEFIHVNYQFENNELVNHFNGEPRYRTNSYINRVIIAGLGKTPKSATLTISGLQDEIEIVPHQSAVAINKLFINMLVDFSIKLNF